MPSAKSSGTDTKPSALNTPTDLSANAAKVIAEVLNAILADSFALYLKTKNFHWHMSGPHFRDYHLMLDEQSDQIFATTDPIAERVRKLGGRTIRSIGHIAKLTRIKNNDAEFVSPLDMRASWRTTTRRSRRRCERRTTSATIIRMSPPPACSKSISTTPSAESGFCSKPRAAQTIAATESMR
jgi:starvation-inducible DNA-binding protein